MDKIYINVRKDVSGALDRVELTEAVARKLLDKWVKILHLEEWRIDFSWCVRARDMACKDALGATTANAISRDASIQLLDPIDHDPATFIPYDYEKTLVHELLHLTFWDMDDTGDNLRDHLTHVMVDRMARALVAAERSVDA